MYLESLPVLLLLLGLSFDECSFDLDEECSFDLWWLLLLERFSLSCVPLFWRRCSPLLSFSLFSLLLLWWWRSVFSAASFVTTSLRLCEWWCDFFFFDFECDEGDRERRFSLNESTESIDRDRLRVDRFLSRRPDNLATCDGMRRPGPDGNGCAFDSLEGDLLLLWSLRLRDLLLLLDDLLERWCSPG